MLWFTILAALILSLPVAWLVYIADKKRNSPRPWLTAGLRGLLFFLLLLLLFAPRIHRNIIHERKPVIVWLQDNSQSAGTALGSQATTYLDAVKKFRTRAENQYTFVSYDLDHLVPRDSSFTFDGTVTDIATALMEINDVYAQQNLGAVILASDGRYNQGANPLYSDVSASGGLYTVALGDTAIVKDLRIAKVYANKTVSLNSQFEIRTDLLANRCAGYRNNCVLRDQNGNILASAQVAISTDNFDGSQSFTIKAAQPGLQKYTISLPAADGEVNITNNTVTVFVSVVEEKKKVLILAAAPHPDINAIDEALDGLEQYETEIRMAEDMPSDLSGYDCIIAHQLPSVYNNIGQRLQNAGRSIWYIVGGQTYVASLNGLQQTLTVNSRGNTLVNVLAKVNPGFAAFVLPRQILSVTDKLPPLAAPAGMAVAAANTEILFRDPGGQPLWVLQRNQTSTAILLGEGLWRWRLYEYRFFKKNEVVDECVRQTVHFLTADTKSKPFRVQLPKYVWNNREQIQLNAYLYNSNNEPINEPDASLTVHDSSGRARSYSLERNGNAYRLNIGALPAGQYVYTAQTSYAGKKYADAGSFAVENSSLEGQETGSDYALLYNMAKRNGGQAFLATQLTALYDSLQHNKRIRPLITETSESTPLADWKWYFFLMLLVATTEWLLRKYWLSM